jgi:hypothetical protein
MLDIQKALRIEYGASRDKRPIFIFKCLNLDCETEIKCRGDALAKASGKCTKHAHQKRPYEHIFKSIGREGGKKSSVLSYEEFVELTKIKKCYYCLDNIPWQKFAYVDGNFTSKAYFLDRADNSKPYSKENCIVCCTHCNKMKGALDHNEFIALCALIAENYRNKLLRNVV